MRKNSLFIISSVFFCISVVVVSCDKIEIPINDINGLGSCVMIVPDIQNYTDNEEYFKYLNSIVDFYNANQDLIDAVFQTGDLTNNNQLWQYENAYNHFFSKFNEKGQLVYCLGNHDYGNNGSSDIRISNYQEYMMPPYDIRMEGSKYENYVRYVILDGRIYGVMVLEFCTRNETLVWANEILKSNTSTPFIILMHVFLDQNGELFDFANPNIENKGSSHKKYKMGDDYKNDSREIFDKIIYNNPNVKLVICGHCLTPSYINVHSESNVDDKLVYMIEVNFQHYSEGGSGCVGLLEILNGNYRIRSYSAYYKKFTGINIVFGERSVE